jgi:WD40 repeat protein
MHTLFIVGHKDKVCAHSNSACTDLQHLGLSLLLSTVLNVITAVESSELCLQRQGSLYTVDIDAQGSLVVSGSTDSMIRLFDARIGAKVRHSYSSSKAFSCNAVYSANCSYYH